MERDLAKIGQFHMYPPRMLAAHLPGWNALDPIKNIMIQLSLIATFLIHIC